MAREVFMTAVGTINTERLHADCKEASVRFAGISTRPKLDGLILVFEDGTPDAEVDKVRAVVTAHDPSLKTDEQQMLENVKMVAQSAVGVGLTDLTAAQVKSLLAVLLWRAGGIAPDGTVKPLVQWVR